MNLYCTGFVVSAENRFLIFSSVSFFSFRDGNSFYPENSDRSGLERPPAQYVNARQLISNSRPNGLRAYSRPDSIGSILVARAIKLSSVYTHCKVQQRSAPSYIVAYLCCCGCRFVLEDRRSFQLRECGTEESCTSGE